MEDLSGSRRDRGSEETVLRQQLSAIRRVRSFRKHVGELREGIGVHTGVSVELRGSCCSGLVAVVEFCLCTLTWWTPRLFAKLSDKMWGSFQRQIYLNHFSPQVRLEIQEELYIICLLKCIYTLFEYSR